MAIESLNARLYLMTPRVADAAALAPLLAEALVAGDVASVLLRLSARDEGTAKRIIQTVAAITAAHDAALLIECDATLAARAGADGVHVYGIGGALEEALASLKPERIVGCGGLTLRHDAMVAGEAGADYVMFGEPRPDGSLPRFEDTLALTRWWAEIFNVPCVAYADAPDKVGELAAAGADFVALGEWIFTDPRGLAGAVRDAHAVLAECTRGAGASPAKRISDSHIFQRPLTVMPALAAGIHVAPPNLRSRVTRDPHRDLALWG